MKRPLQVGDRVVVYGVTKTENGEPFGLASSVDPGVVTEVLKYPPFNKNCFKYRADNTQRIYIAHKNQCRRLIPNSQRRRVWIKFDDSGYNSQFVGVRADKQEGYTEFIEVRKKK